MAQTIRLVQAALLCLCLCGCQREIAVASQTPAVPLPPATAAPPANPDSGSTKGLELYSMQSADGRWYYYLLGGTNRLKMMSEVVSSNPAIGAEAFKIRLRALPPGSSIFWSTQAVSDRPNGRLTLPDADTIRQITEVCRFSGLDLHIRG